MKIAEKNMPLVIEGKKYTWNKQFINGSELKQLAHIDPEKEIYLSLQDPWDDELISNDSNVDLARPGVEHFFVKKKLLFFINGQRHVWHSQYISEKDLRIQGGIGNEEEIYLDNKGSFEDTLINKNEKIDLARPGVEHFYSVEKEREITLIVNGTPKRYDKKKITFEEVIILAYGTYVDKPTMVYTVAYEDGPRKNPEGSMTKGGVVMVKNKMIFHATATDKS